MAKYEREAWEEARSRDGGNGCIVPFVIIAGGLVGGMIGIFMFVVEHV